MFFPVRRCFFLFLVTFAVVTLLFTSIGWAQNTSQLPSNPQNDNGTNQYGSYDGVHENVSLSSGNLSFCIPLLSLPGRNKHDLNIPLCYNSQFKEAQGTTAFDRVSWFPWVWGSSTAPMGPGWTLTGRPGMYLGGTFGSPVATTPDGGIYNFSGSAAGGAPDYTGSDTAGANMYSTFNASGAGFDLYLEDGTQVLTNNSSGSSTSTTVYDTNGNFIDYESSYIKDTIGRTVNVTARRK